MLTHYHFRICPVTECWRHRLSCPSVCHWRRRQSGLTSLVTNTDGRKDQKPRRKLSSGLSFGLYEGSGDSVFSVVKINQVRIEGVRLLTISLVWTVKDKNLHISER